MSIEIHTPGPWLVKSSLVSFFIGAHFQKVKAYIDFTGTFFGLCALSSDP